MRVHYAVSFEFPMRPPVTHNGTVEAGQAHACASRAIKSARAALRPVGWSSLVCTLLERASDLNHPHPHRKDLHHGNS